MTRYLQVLKVREPTASAVVCRPFCSLHSTLRVLATVYLDDTVLAGGRGQRVSTWPLEPRGLLSCQLCNALVHCVTTTRPFHGVVLLSRDGINELRISCALHLVHCASCAHMILLWCTEQCTLCILLVWIIIHIDHVVMVVQERPQFCGLLCIHSCTV